jgi:SAM-dependent methyltransferase
MPSSGSSLAERKEVAAGLRRLTTARLALRALSSRGREFAPFAAHLALDARAFIASRASLPGVRVLDLGSGHGELGRELEAAGATVVSLDLRPLGGPRRVIGDARQTLPFAAGAFGGVACSNLLEHVPSTSALLGEAARVLQPGGWMYLSWTAWFGPLGGHEHSPWHYLGVRAAAAAARRRSGPARNVAGRDLFPVHVGPTIREIERTGWFDVHFAGPRYWPSQRWIVRTPVLREVATWNCLLFLVRR